MLAKAHLALHSRMSSSRWLITPSGLSRSLILYLYRSSVFSCHFLISSASVRSLTLMSFIVPFFEWNIPSVQFSCSVMSNSLRPHELQHARPPWHEFNQTHVHLISDAIQPSYPLLSPSPPAPNPSQNQSFPMSQLFAWGGQSTGVSASASFLPKKSQGWSPLEWTGWISLQSRGLSRLFSNTTVQKHQFFSAQPSSQSNSHIHTWPQEKP